MTWILLDLLIAFAALALLAFLVLGLYKKVKGLSKAVATASETVAAASEGLAAAQASGPLGQPRPDAARTPAGQAQDRSRTARGA